MNYEDKYGNHNNSFKLKLHEKIQIGRALRPAPRTVRSVHFYSQAHLQLCMRRPTFRQVGLGGQQPRQIWTAAVINGKGLLWVSVGWSTHALFRMALVLSKEDLNSPVPHRMADCIIPIFTDFIYSIFSQFTLSPISHNFCAAMELLLVLCLAHCPGTGSGMELVGD